jgi:hypothetical protein
MPNQTQPTTFLIFNVAESAKKSGHYLPAIGFDDGVGENTRVIDLSSFLGTSVLRKKWDGT